jgi:hypothetical protein
MRWHGATLSTTNLLRRLVELRSITAVFDRAAWQDWVHRKRRPEECFCLGFATSVSAGGVALLIVALSSEDMGGNAPWSVSKAHAVPVAAAFSYAPRPGYASDLTSPGTQIIIRRESTTAARVPTHDATSFERQVWWKLSSSIVATHPTDTGPLEPQR